MSNKKQTKKPLAGTPPDQKPISSKPDWWAITEHPHSPTNLSPFAESKWSFADQLLNLRGGMVSSIGDIFKLNKFKQSATQRMNRLRKDSTKNTNTIRQTNRDVKALQDWREIATKDIADIVGSGIVSPIGVKNLTELTDNMAEQHAINIALEARVNRLEAIIWGTGFAGALLLFIFMVKLFVEHYSYGMGG